MQELPEELSACRKLERLAVNSNKLSYLPQVGFTYIHIDFGAVERGRIFGPKKRHHQILYTTCLGHEPKKTCMT